MTMDVQPEAIDLSAVTESGISASMGASAAAASAALCGVTPMGADADSLEFAVALNAAGAAYLGVTAEHAGQRVAYSGAQGLGAATYQTVDVISKSAFLTP
ncbi:PE domain-containing protein [soil metagenome]